MRSLLSLFYFSIAGVALSVIFGLAWGIYQSEAHKDALAAQGVVIADLPLEELLLGWFELDVYALLGATLGLLVGLIWLCGRGFWGLLRRLARTLFGGRRATELERYKADEILQADRESRADAYLRRRAQEKHQRDR